MNNNKSHNTSKVHSRPLFSSSLFVKYFVSFLFLFWKIFLVVFHRLHLASVFRKRNVYRSLLTCDLDYFSVSNIQCWFDVGVVWFVFLECLTIQRIVQTPLQCKWEWECNCFGWAVRCLKELCECVGVRALLFTLLVNSIRMQSDQPIQNKKKNTKTHSHQVANLGNEMQFSSKYTLCSFPCLNRSVSTATLWRAEKLSQPNDKTHKNKYRVPKNKPRTKNQRTKKPIENRTKIRSQNYNWNCL